MMQTAMTQGVSGVVYGDLQGVQERLPGAILVWENTRSGTATNLGGEFHIGRPPGASRLIASYLGFKNDTITCSLNDSVIIFHLKADADLDPLILREEITSTRMAMRDPQYFQVLGEKELCKAACCNLSESFETNASVDATYTDAVTGVKQIRMLGLEGIYSQLLFDNLPAARGLAAISGLSYIPGPWVKSIYIGKGAGSVTNGWESMTGQINVALKNPENAEHLQLNAYSGSGGRNELNIVWNPLKEDEDHHEHGEKEWHLRPILLAHGAYSNLRTDMNDDRFMDNPTFQNLSIRNEWLLESHSGISATANAQYTSQQNISGQLNYKLPIFTLYPLWGITVNTQRIDANAKLGYVFKDKPWKSIGSQWTWYKHHADGNYGFRNYTGQENYARANMLFASRIANDKHKFVLGVSAVINRIGETVTPTNPILQHAFIIDRTEKTYGASAEYTWEPSPATMLIAGMRADENNIYGLLLSPRIHIRHAWNDFITTKLSAGKGYRSPVIFMDHVGVLASNREIIIQGDAQGGIQGLRMEESWNYGINTIFRGKLNHRDATLSVDAFRTQFVQQVVTDLETAGVVSFYNLNGSSISNSFQVEGQWSPWRRFDVRLAYRWLDVRSQYTSGMLFKPLLNKHRAFTNLAYETKSNSKGRNFRFDMTAQWISRKRIPLTAAHHEGASVRTASDAYWQIMAQATWVVKKNFEIYLGGENLTNFMVHDAILFADATYDSNFDASLIWGPVFGRMGYVGLRWIVD
ncbi:MAG: TonB-dependent receptor domain-containing protein [Flavobacteriales bacterium]